MAGSELTDRQGRPTATGIAADVRAATPSVAAELAVPYPPGAAARWVAERTQRDRFVRGSAAYSGVCAGAVAALAARFPGARVEAKPVPTDPHAALADGAQSA